jgi:hypothetical protein
MAVSLPHATAIPEPIATGRLTVGSAIPLLLDQLRQAGAGPFLDLPLPQLPPPSELPAAPQPPHPPAIAQPGDVSHLLAPPPEPAAATAPASAGLPQLPALPANPVDMLMQGLHIPGMPGVDQLMSPLLGLLNSFGSGILGAFNPSDILQEGAQVMESAVQTGGEALTALMQSWHGGAAQSAHSSGTQTADRGNTVSQQGKTIAEITNKAADQVNRGYQRLTGIIRNFAAQVVPIAATGAILTPPGQSALMGVATSAFGLASVVMGQTQAALAGLTAEVNAAGGLIQVLENSGVDVPGIAGQVADVAQPVVSQVGNTISGALGAHDDAGFGGGGQNIADGLPFGGFPGADQTSAASYPGDPLAGGAFGFGGGAPGLDGGGGSFGGFGGGADSGGAPGGGGPLAEPTLGGAPALGAPVLPGSATGGVGTTGTAPLGGSAPMGGVAPAAMGRGTEGQHHRSVQPYQTTAHRITGSGLEPVAPAVLGADDPEADARYESEYGYYSDPDGDHGHTSNAG